MIAHSLPFSKIISSDQGSREHYHVPKYQREYSWGKRDWERLLNDIDENDNGYFMGSVICVREDHDPHSPGDEIIYEVVDGQQRLTTLSLLMMVIYQRLVQQREGMQFSDEDDRQDFENALSSLRNKLVKKKRQGEFRPNEAVGWIEEGKMCFVRVQPSAQNNNVDDYKYLLGEAGLLKTREKPRYLGVRAMCKAFRYFEQHVSTNSRELLALVAKINQLVFVHIAVGSQADAFTLFETLNNRGVPLSAIDIIKNKMLAEMDKQHQVDVDESFERWQSIIEAIPEPVDQERFLRHFYNAYRWDKEIRVDGVQRAIKSRIILVYEKLIRKGAKSIFESLCQKASLYGELINPEESGFDDDTASLLLDLARTNASPAYLLFLYLFSLDKKHFGEKKFLDAALQVLIKYFVRRNVTDFPGTKALDQIHIDLVEACQAQIDSGKQLTAAFLQSQLLTPSKCASRQQFEAALLGPMYDTNNLVTRYLLVKLDETHHSREYAPDLWARNDGDKYVWTVEHVLPQTENIPKDWVEMIADGDKARAQQIHSEQVDRLGNLTLSGYNSKLATASLQKKQKLAERRKILGHSINIGYENGLALNGLKFKVGKSDFTLATSPEWNERMIEGRTRTMVSMLMKMYSFDGETQ